MRKYVITVLSYIFVVVLLIGATTAFAASSPNYATNDHDDMSLYYYGYVQCQPSYLEDGNHAARGYIRYQRFDLLGNISKDTGRLYTAYGNGPTDSRILSRSHTFTDSIIPNPYKTQFWYGFDWVSSGSGIWPVSIPGGTVTK
ncbi:MAG: hypothetical protein RRY79_05620 [Clostridia bacterium]